MCHLCFQLRGGIDVGDEMVRRFVQIGVYRVRRIGMALHGIQDSLQDVGGVVLILDEVLMRHICKDL